MSFRRFIYYSTLIGAWTAFLGWGMAHVVAYFVPRGDVLFYAIFLGLTVAFGLSLVDALWNFSPSQFMPIAARVLSAVALGLLGSATCGGLGWLAFDMATERLGLWVAGVILILIWVGLGLLVGLSVGVFELVA